MYINNVRRREECQHEAELDLRKFGIKLRLKKPKLKPNAKSHGKVFEVALEALPKQTVTLQSGQQITVPKLVHELCSFILTKAQTEGIFRKEGSRARQNEIKVLLSKGDCLTTEQVIDVAVLLKTFLRQLPEPLIPYAYHELFLRCVLLDQGQKTEALLLACLLLPSDYLDTLTYLLQFLRQIADKAKSNKMNAYNLSVVIGPNAFPIEEKLSPNPKIRADKTNELFELLIENASSVGYIPDEIIERVGKNTDDDQTDKKKKKRRSGSLTRMFNGLKKIVGGKGVDDAPIVTPDLLLTPINQSIRKRRILRQSNGISNKKRNELIGRLPDAAILNTPFTPQKTPVSMAPQTNRNTAAKERKGAWFSRSRSVKNLKAEVEPPLKARVERRWSTLGTTKIKPIKEVVRQPSPEPDYIRVNKIEYEAIKNRVSAMERRISIELDTVQTRITTEEGSNEKKTENHVQNVQTVYEKTLQQAESLSPGTDQLARRLSRELRIRRSVEQKEKVMRSPSARKIGSLRRRSSERSSSRLPRQERGRRSRRESFELGPKGRQSGAPSCNLSGSSCDTWTSAEGYFETMQTSGESSSNLSDRASIAKLRQNPGLVLAKAKLFDQLRDEKITRKVGTKLGSARNHEARMSYRMRALKSEDRRLDKKNVSPRRRNHNLVNRQRMQARQLYLEGNGDGRGLTGSPKVATPQIKRSLNVKSPKRLCRTPVRIERSTPLRVVKTPTHLF